MCCAVFHHQHRSRPVLAEWKYACRFVLADLSFQITLPIQGFYAFNYKRLAHVMRIPPVFKQPCRYFLPLTLKRENTHKKQFPSHDKNNEKDEALVFSV